MNARETSGAFWGGLWGLFFGSAFFRVPEPGPRLVAGPRVGRIVGALESAVIVGGTHGPREAATRARELLAGTTPEALDHHPTAPRA